ncbi:hypothetical protein KC326_g6420 [Hortaea werneckii]|nr:hypothetical protein KC326_g6420 [Hortaea werneckii]
MSEPRHYSFEQAYAAQKTDPINQAATPPRNKLFLVSVKDVDTAAYMIKHLAKTLPGAILVPGAEELDFDPAVNAQLDPLWCVSWTATEADSVNTVTQVNALARRGPAHGPLHNYLHPQAPVIIVHPRVLCRIPPTEEFANSIAPITTIDINTARYSAKICNHAADAMKHLLHFPTLTILIQRGWDAGARDGLSVKVAGGNKMMLFSRPPLNIYLIVDRAWFVSS